jgi:hypothetical protein
MSHQGWEPRIGEYLTLEEVVEAAFDYRGNVTVVMTDGAELEGYVFNRDREVAEPFIQMFDLAGHGPLTLPYARIRTIRFTGRDMAAGSPWLAWLERKEKEQAGPA